MLFKIHDILIFEMMAQLFFPIDTSNNSFVQFSIYRNRTESRRIREREKKHKHNLATNLTSQETLSA